MTETNRPSPREVEDEEIDNVCQDENEPTFEGKVMELDGIGLWSSIVEVSIENDKEGLNLMFDRRSFDQMLDDMTSTPNKLLGLSVIVHGLPGQEWLEFSHPRTK